MKITQSGIQTSIDDLNNMLDAVRTAVDGLATKEVIISIERDEDGAQYYFIQGVNEQGSKHITSSKE